MINILRQCRGQDIYLWCQRNESTGWFVVFFFTRNKNLKYREIKKILCRAWWNIGLTLKHPFSSSFSQWVSFRGVSSGRSGQPVYPSVWPQLLLRDENVPKVIPEFWDFSIRVTRNHSFLISSIWEDLNLKLLRAILPTKCLNEEWNSAETGRAKSQRERVLMT